MPHKTVVRGGVNIPSVTQIIGCLDKPGLYNWYGKYGTEECNRIKIESGLFGTAVHDLIEQYITGVTKPMEWPESVDQEKANLCAENFKVWYKESGLEVINAEPEDAVYSKRYNFQGTWDFIGSKNGIILCADWKTSNSLYESVGLQLSAYAHLYGEAQGWSDEEIFKKIPDGLAVRIDKKTCKVYPKQFTGLKHYFNVFKHLIPVHEFHTQTGAWDHRE